MEHKGFQYDFTPSELRYLLFGKKRCPRCGGQLVKRKGFESVKGEQLNTGSDALFIPNAQVKHYLYFFTCQSCGREYTLEELAK